MKKKILTLALALVLALSLSIPAFAEEPPATDAIDGTAGSTFDGTGSGTVAVTGTVTKTSMPENAQEIARGKKVYSVTVTWSTNGEGLSVKQNANYYEWSPTDGKYVIKTDNTMVKNDTDSVYTTDYIFSIINKSNDTIGYNITFAPANTNIASAVQKADTTVLLRADLTSAEHDTDPFAEAGTATSASPVATVTVSSLPDSEILDGPGNYSFGTFTVTITAGGNAPE